MRDPSKSRGVTIRFEVILIAASRWIGREITRMVIARLLRRLAAYGRTDGDRFLINIPGRGYCFVAAVTVSSGRPDLQVLKTRVGEPSVYNVSKAGILFDLTT